MSTPARLAARAPRGPARSLRSHGAGRSFVAPGPLINSTSHAHGAEYVGHLERCPASIAGEYRAVEAARVVRREEHHHLRDLVGLLESTRMAEFETVLDRVGRPDHG